MPMLHYFALGLAILLGVAGQLALKGGAEQAETIVRQFSHPLTIAGLGIYVISGLLYVVALKGLPVSVAFPSVAASYAIVAVAAHFLWQEPLGLQQAGGIALIGAGLLVLHAH
jgi:multidrug transporter EmrE-like cation transporter